MQTTPVIDLYRRFGKVREVSGEFDELTVYELLARQHSALLFASAQTKDTLTSMSFAKKTSLMVKTKRLSLCILSIRYPTSWLQAC